MTNNHSDFFEGLSDERAVEHDAYDNGKALPAKKKKNKNTAAIMFYVEPKTKKALKQLALNRNKKVSDLLREMIAKELGK